MSGELHDQGSRESNRVRLLLPRFRGFESRRPKKGTKGITRTDVLQSVDDESRHDVVVCGVAVSRYGVLVVVVLRLRTTPVRIETNTFYGAMSDPWVCTLQCNVSTHTTLPNYRR